jgi:hypothetical protein
MAKPVGKLRKINLNEVWGNEPDGFGTWLQQEEILEILGDSIEVALKPAGGEIPLDTLPGGVVAKDAKHGHYVIVFGHLDGINSDKLELWRIDDSVPAPNFNVVCKPNMWARQLKMGQEEGEGAGAPTTKDFPESKSKKEDSGKGSKEKVAAGDKSGKDGVSVRQNFVYTKTFS